jgi:hypothetical protein
MGVVSPFIAMIHRSLVFALLGSFLFGTDGHAQQPVQSPPAADFYVAPNGQDTNPGTADAPFATLARARDAVREKIAAGLDKDILVSIHGGVYPQTEALSFGPADSGTENHAVTYASAPGEQVVLSGGRAISGWQKGSGEIWTTQIPDVQAGKWYFRQLFVNGVRATRARTPNASEWWKITSSTATKDAPPAENAPITIKVSGKVAAWKNPGDIELVYMQNNESGRKKLGSIDEQAQSFTLAPPNRWNPKAFADDWPLSMPFAGKPCFLENALEMLDQPGEWYLDRQTGTLSYWPRPGEDLTQAEVIAPALQNTMLTVSGTADKPVLNLHFQGLHVRYVDWPLPAWGYMALFCCNVATTDGPKPGHRPIEAAVEFKNAQQCSFSDGAITDAGGMGLCLREGTSKITIEGNEIGDLGGGGIVFGWPNVAAGYLDAAPPPKPGEYSDFRIANNLVHDCGEDYFGAVGILLFGASHTVVSHNLIHDTAYLGIGVAGTQDPKVAFGGDNRIEFNHIHDAMETTIDGAGIYITFAQNGGGTILRGNVIHDTHGNPNHEHDGQKWGDHPPSAGIYLDGNTEGGIYDQNILYRNLAAGPLIFDYADAKEKNRWIDNLLFQDSTPPAEFIEATERFAGLEPAYAAKLTKTAGNPCVRYVLDDSSPGATWSAIQYDLPAEGRGVVAIVVHDDNAEKDIQLKLRGLREGAYQLQAYNSVAAPAKVWGPEEMPMLGAVQSADLAALGLSSPLAGRQLLDEGLSLKPGKSPQAIWIAYHR